MSPSPPKHRKLIAQARYFRLVEFDQPEVCLLPDVTSLSFLLVPLLPLSGTSCNVQYSGSPQRETWSKSTDIHTLDFFLVHTVDTLTLFSQFDIVISSFETSIF